MATATLSENSLALASAEQAGTMQLVSFHLAEEIFGIEITRIREIILVCEITRIPHTLPFVKGLINLRSMVIPVIDLRTMFGFEPTTTGPDSRIMVVNLGARTVGIIVDSVDEVLRIGRDQLAPAPPTVTNLGNEYLAGLVRLQEHLLILLDIERLLGGQALGDVCTVAP